MTQKSKSAFATEFDQSRQMTTFLNELDMGIRAANQEIVHERIPDLSREKAFVFATMVARLRADYLDAAFRHCSPGAPLDSEAIEDLRAKRLTYEEAREAFQALRHAIEVGYIDIEQMSKR
ncbi:hypothetical protein [Pelagibius sp. 7325]|uniref:hypothetical protein n=1 Tax=Pelagibius sp. 7325 TaxID=3131994 RepID=UPI0030EEB271